MKGFFNLKLPEKKILCPQKIKTVKDIFWGKIINFQKILIKFCYYIIKKY